VTSSDRLSRWFGEPFCYLTTTGRRSGLPRTIEIWFAGSGSRLYLLAENGDRAHWVRNIRADPAVLVRLGDGTWRATAQLLDPPEADLARRLVAAKFEPWREGLPLSAWVRAARPVAIEPIAPIQEPGGKGE
jgi:deazaflavin-dependent oxidoreductase (nitroreductase family)